MSYHNEPICITGIKKSLKISKGVVHQRRTDNTMAKRKRTKGDQQNTTQKIKDRATRKSTWNSAFVKVNISTLSSSVRLECTNSDYQYLSLITRVRATTSHFNPSTQKDHLLEINVKTEGAIKNR
jgi:hypothetical protein